MRSATAPQNQANRISELESIRGVAALLVVFYHIPRWNPAFYDVAIVRNGYLMVDLFFVLSGFVIHRAYASKLATGAELLRFQFLRFSRLYPVHLLFLLFFVVVEIGKYTMASKLGVGSKPFSENSLTALVQQIFLVQAVGPTGNDFTFNVPAWSISVEFYTYLLFGLIVLHAGRAKNVVFLGIAVFALGALVSQSLPGYGDLLHCFAGFFLGCMTAHLSSKVSLRLPSYAPLVTAAAFVAFLYLKTDKQHDPLVYLFSAVIILAVVFAEGGVAKQVLNSRPLHRLGTISYSVYMCHSAVLWVFNFTLGKLLKRPEVMFHGKSAPQLGVGETFVCYCLVILIVVLLSNAVYEWVEKPLRERSRRVEFGNRSVIA